MFVALRDLRSTLSTRFTRSWWNKPRY